MKVYYESVFLLNFLLDFMILYGTKRILKVNQKNIRLILGGIVGSCTTFLLMYKVSSILLFLFKMIISILMILISFGKNSFFKNMEYFYLLSIITGGVFYLFDLPKNILVRYFILIIGSLGIIYLLIKELLKIYMFYNDKYDIKI